jgi:hypothetical protein
MLDRIPEGMSYKSTKFLENISNKMSNNISNNISDRI